MSRTWLLSWVLFASLAVLGCDEELLCPAIQIDSTFTLVFDSPEWKPANYTIEVSYDWRTGPHTYTCPVGIPSFAIDDDADAGTPVPIAGASADARPDFFTCTSTGREVQAPFAAIGRSIVLTFSETPERIHVVVRNAGETIVDEDVELEYETTHEACQDVDHATHRIQL